MQQLSGESVTFIGQGLSRPECALAHASDYLFAPDWTGSGGISVIAPDGRVKRHLATNWRDIRDRFGLDEGLRANGICLLDGGDFLVAHLGAERGGLFRLTVDGTVDPVLTELDGKPLPPSNFVTVDGRGRIWFTVSTRKVPRGAAYRSDVADGFIGVIDEYGARIVADGLGYTNECLPHPDGKRLLLNETFARRLTAFDIGSDGSLSNRTTLAEFRKGTFPDGLAFDENGDVWITSIVSNRVLHVAMNGTSEDGVVSVYLEDVTHDHLDWVEDAYRIHAMDRPHLDTAAGKRLRNVSNLAFCGEHLDEAVLGCLLGHQLARIPMPVRGARPVHWTADIAPLIRALDTMPNV